MRDEEVEEWRDGWKDEWKDGGMDGKDGGWVMLWVEVSVLAMSGTACTVPNREFSLLPWEPCYSSSLPVCSRSSFLLLFTTIAVLRRCDGGPGADLHLPRSPSPPLRRSVSI